MIVHPQIFYSTESVQFFMLIGRDLFVVSSSGNFGGKIFDTVTIKKDNSLQVPILSQAHLSYYFSKFYDHIEDHMRRCIIKSK